MSVLIKGMEMPDGCVVCPFFIENRHDRGDDSLCRASGKEAKCGCPLVPVPPHGRLIDGDALLNDACSNCEPFSCDHNCTLAVLIKDAPTIIPADHIGDANEMVKAEEGE